MTDPAPVLELIDGFRRSKTMFAAVELGIFDGARPAGAGMDRLLDACVAMGLLEKRDGEYRNTPLADEYLRRTSPGTLSGYIRFANRSLYPLWAHLEDAVLEGTPRWSQTFGGVWGWRRLGSGILAGLRQAAGLKPGRASGDFAAGMHGLGRITSPEVVKAFDLSRFHRLIDLGGATGHLALAARERYPEMEVGVFDLPGVIEIAKEYAGTAELFAGDLLADPLPGADLYALGKVLHNLSAENIRRLLEKIHQALPQGGGLLLAERLLDEDRRGPASVLIHSLNMLVCTAGRERSLSEYRELLAAAGFREVQSKRTGTLLDAMLAIK
jgi:acetylserotonin N-methyltransferase